MSLVPDYEDSATSSSSEDTEPEPASVPKTRLPAPDFLSNSAQTSVFKNPFTEAENAKQAILQKHVKMVESRDNVVVINGKKVCWNYRKGRCRFGHKCKFSHDSDLQKTSEELVKETQIQTSVIFENATTPQPSAEQLEKIREEGIKESLQKRKKRPGLSQGLVPGKKVMKKYNKEKVVK